jgi:hypothetical protein
MKSLTAHKSPERVDEAIRALWHIFLQIREGCVIVRRLSFAVTLATAVTVCGISYAGDDENGISPFPVQQGFAISPVKLNLAGKDPLKVGLGSYLVNAVGDCSGCHSFPQFLEKGGPGTNPAAGDPFEATPSTQSVSRQLVANFNFALFGRRTVLWAVYGA